MTSPTPNIHRWRAFSLLAVAAFMTVMDLTIVNTALPTIGRKLHFSQTSLLWVVTAYGLAYGGFLLLGGRAADLLGRRRMIIAGLAVFTAASLGASLAGSEAVLIAMRAVQGLGAACFSQPHCRPFGTCSPRAPSATRRSVCGEVSPPSVRPSGSCSAAY